LAGCRGAPASTSTVAPFGSFAQRALISEEIAIPLPDELGSAAALTISRAALAGRRLLTYGNRTTPAAVKRAAYERMCRHLLAGELRVEHECIELERFADAFARQTRHPHRKLVLVPPGLANR
jgi:hypothetical protein